MFLSLPQAIVPNEYAQPFRAVAVYGSINLLRYHNDQIYLRWESMRYICPECGEVYEDQDFCDWIDCDYDGKLEAAEESK